MSSNEEERTIASQQTRPAPRPETTQGPVIPGTPPVNNSVDKTNEEHASSTQGASETDMKSTTSSKKAEANRLNSSKSTGARTEIGKRTVAKNAVKHGFFSKYALILRHDADEDPSEYQKLFAALREHYQPFDFLEELWVEKIAVWSWRLRRLLRCESGQIARALAEHSHGIKQSAAIKDELGLPNFSKPEIDAITDHLFLPPKEELDKLLRYEAMINKQLNHAIAELERLQRRRNGEVVPAPISVDISGGN